MQASGASWARSSRGPCRTMPSERRSGPYEATSDLQPTPQWPDCPWCRTRHDPHASCEDWRGRMAPLVRAVRSRMLRSWATGPWNMFARLLLVRAFADKARAGLQRPCPSFLRCASFSGTGCHADPNWTSLAFVSRLVTCRAPSPEHFVFHSLRCLVAVAGATALQRRGDTDVDPAGPRWIREACQLSREREWTAKL